MLNEVYIKFSVENFSVSHFEISSKLGIKPSKVWSIGDLKTEKGTIRYHNNGWQLNYKKQNVKHIDKALEELLDILLLKQYELRCLDNDLKKISIAIYSKSLMPSFVYDNEFITFLYKTKIQLEHDIYCL